MFKLEWGCEIDNFTDTSKLMLVVIFENICNFEFVPFSNSSIYLWARLEESSDGF